MSGSGERRGGRCGTYAEYSAGCRCEACRQAARDYKAARRRAMGIGTKGEPPPDSSDGRDMPERDLTWRRYGACVGKPTAWWYPSSEVLLTDEVLEAKALCEGCPVKEQCLAWALAHEDDGIWAGTSERERRRIRRRAGIRLDTGRRVDELVAGRRWVRIEAVVDGAAPLVPPGVAFRFQERHRAKPRSGVTRPERRQVPNEAKVVALGQRALIHKVILDRVARGAFERDGDRIRRRRR